MGDYKYTPYVTYTVATNSAGTINVETINQATINGSCHVDIESILIEELKEIEITKNLGTIITHMAIEYDAIQAGKPQEIIDRLREKRKEL